MPEYQIDFQVVKARISMMQAMTFLGLNMKKESTSYRSHCPSCDAEHPHNHDRCLSVKAEEGTFFCQAMDRGGDVIFLVAHIRRVSMFRAAKLLVDRYGLDEAPAPRTEPQRQEPPPQQAVQPQQQPQVEQKASEKPQAGKDGDLKPLDHLDENHEAVKGLGFTPEDAEALGVGYTSKGLMKGLVALPVRNAAGRLLGYVGIPAGTKLKLPKTWKFA